MVKVFLLDNHDSFTYNLAAMLRTHPTVKLTIGIPETTDIGSLKAYDKIIFSPGPGLPREFPMMFSILDLYKDTKSILGVCLGHQTIGEYFGAQLSNFDKVSHGVNKKLHILTPESVLLKNVPDNSEIGVYHSWYLSKSDFPSSLLITSECTEGVIMSIEHKKYNIQSVQFHPESFITQYGFIMIDNWLKQ